VQERQQRLQGPERVQGPGVTRPLEGLHDKGRQGRHRPEVKAGARMGFARKDLDTHRASPEALRRFLAEAPAVAGRAISENSSRRGVAVLEKVRRDVPVVLHGVSLPSVRSTRSMRACSAACASWPSASSRRTSRHLCWGRHPVGTFTLLPLPFTEEALAHVVSRVKQVQEVLGRQILLENVSSYVEYASSTMSEWSSWPGSRRSGLRHPPRREQRYVERAQPRVDPTRTLPEFRWTASASSTWPATATTAATCWTRTTLGSGRRLELYRSALRRFGGSRP